ncbi:hypothetical protein C9I56_11720 [Paraburkholderia caribensis]|nr:hypothetical protein C9I56_11720 [Paraburkholderia caribensis]
MSSQRNGVSPSHIRQSLTKAMLERMDLTEDTIPVFEKLLALHDAQLAVAPLHKVVDAERQLRRFLERRLLPFHDPMQSVSEHSEITSYRDRI